MPIMLRIKRNSQKRWLGTNVDPIIASFQRKIAPTICHLRLYLEKGVPILSHCYLFCLPVSGVSKERTEYHVGDHEARLNETSPRVADVVVLLHFGEHSWNKKSLEIIRFFLESTYH